MPSNDEMVPKDKIDTGIANIFQDPDGKINITLRKEKFEEFLFSFFGNKEKLIKSYNIDYLLTHQDMLQFHYLLLKKIQKEQFISIALLTAEINYDDDTSRIINTIEALENYDEPNDLGVISASLTWDLIFKMPSMQTIQQQKISLNFHTKYPSTNRGAINIIIDHTNQIWASEVIRLFEEHIKKIQLRNTFIFRFINKVSHYKIFNIMLGISFLLSLSLVGYLEIQNAKLLEPIKVKEEFMFDIADVISNNKKNNIDLLIQFYLIRDLEKTAPQIISHLNKKGYFSSQFKEIIDKRISGYYNRDKGADKITYTNIALLKEIDYLGKIISTYSFLRYLILYIILYIAASIYLKLFRMNSIVAITNKEYRKLEKQNKIKSNSMQIMFGLLVSIVSAIIFEYGIKLFLLR